MRIANQLHNQWRLVPALLLTAAVITILLTTGITAWAQSNPQTDPVTGLSANTGSNPGEIDVSWNAHPAGATQYRVA